MNDEQVALERLDALDRDIARIEGEIAAAAKRLADADAALTAATAAHVEARGRLDASRTDERANQRRIDEFRASRASATRILETGAGNADAAQRQLDRCDALIDEAETAMLELLERQDAIQAEVTRAEAALARATEVRTAAAAEVPVKRAALDAELAERTGQRAPAFEALPAELRNRYADFRARNRWAVAKVRDNACEACAMAVQPQMVVDLRRDRLVTCHGCHRWLSIPV